MSSLKTFFLWSAVFLFVITTSANAYREVIDLGTVGGTQSCARFINDNGQIVGWACDEDGTQLPCLFDSSGNGLNIKLMTPFFSMSGTATCINNSGQIVGYTQQIHYGTDYYRYPMIFNPGGTNVCLAGSGGYNYGYALSINDNGQIVGLISNRLTFAHFKV